MRRGEQGPPLPIYATVLDRKPPIHVNARAIIERSNLDNVEIVVQVRNKPYEGGKWIELPGCVFTSRLHRRKRQDLADQVYWCSIRWK